MPSLNRMYSPQLWITVIGPYAAMQHVPIPFAIAAITEESGGNPCEIGNPEQYGPDGNPREMGIYQFYNPDDLQLLKIPGHNLRAYCNPNKVPYKTKDGRTIMGPSKEVIRPLTAAEMGEQGKATIDKIVHDRNYAGGYAAASGVRWPMEGVDFWRLVKLVHGLPGIVSSGLANVHAHLGRPTSSWSEFRHLIESGTVHCDDETEKYRGDDGYGWIFNNAEKATSTMQGKAIA
jgi:hypothetical protein